MIRQIGILLYPDFQLLDAAGVTAAFEIAGGFGGAAYEMTPLSHHGGLVRSSSGMAIETVPLATAGSFDTLIVVGDEGHRPAMSCPELQAFIRYQATTARRICSVCTGAFLLAAAGMLDGRRVTTHWQQAATLKALFPEVMVSADAIHVHDGPVWTSAGISAGIDMALALITEDLGADIARRTAQQMVVFYHRPGGQSQFSALLEMASPQERFADLLGWDPIQSKTTLDRRRSCKSGRNEFAKFFTQFSSSRGDEPRKSSRTTASRSRTRAGGEIYPSYRSHHRHDGLS